VHFLKENGPCITFEGATGVVSLYIYLCIFVFKLLARAS